MPKRWRKLAAEILGVLLVLAFLALVFHMYSSGDRPTHLYIPGAPHP